MKIYYNSDTYQVDNIIDTQEWVVGDNQSKTLEIYFTNITSLNVYDYECLVAFRRPDNQTSNNILLTPDPSGYYKITLTGWVSDVTGTLRITTKLKNGTVVEAFGIVNKNIAAGVVPSNATISDEQYEQLLEQVNLLFDIKLNKNWVDLQNLTTPIEDNDTIVLNRNLVPYKTNIQNLKNITIDFQGTFTNAEYQLEIDNNFTVGLYRYQVNATINEEAKVLLVGVGDNGVVYQTEIDNGLKVRYYDVNSVTGFYEWSEFENPMAEDVNDLTEQVLGIINGSIIVGKAYRDANNNVINTTYETINNSIGRVNSHNTNEASHPYILGRLDYVQEEIDRLNARGKSYGEINYTQTQLQAMTIIERNTAIVNDILSRFPNYVQQSGDMVYTKLTETEISHEWEYNPAVGWVDNGADIVRKATNTQFGIVKGDASPLNGIVSITDGKIVEVRQSNNANYLNSVVNPNEKYSYENVENEFDNRYTKEEVDALIQQLKNVYDLESSILFDEFILPLFNHDFTEEELIKINDASFMLVEFQHSGNLGQVYKSIYLSPSSYVGKTLRIYNNQYVDFSTYSGTLRNNYTLSNPSIEPLETFQVRITLLTDKQLILDASNILYREENLEEFLDNVVSGEQTVGLAEEALSLANTIDIEVDDIFKTRVTAKMNNEVVDGPAEILELGGQTVKQMIMNSSFSNTSGWGVDNGSQTVINGINTITGNGTNLFSQLYIDATNRTQKRDGSVLFAKVDILLPNVTDLVNVSIMLSGETKTYTSIQMNKWLSLFIKVATPNDNANANLSFRMQFTSNTTQSGKQMSIRNPQLFNLTDIGLQDLTEDELYVLFANKNYDFGLNSIKPTQLISTNDNLMNFIDFYSTLRAINPNDITTEINDDRQCIKINSPFPYELATINGGLFKPNTRYRLRCEMKNVTSQGFGLRFLYQDGTVSSALILSNTPIGTWGISDHLSTSGKTIQSLVVHSNGNGVTYLNIQKFMLQIADNPETDFIEYKDEILPIPITNPVFYPYSLPNGDKNKIIKNVNGTFTIQNNVNYSLLTGNSLEDWAIYQQNNATIQGFSLINASLYFPNANVNPSSTNETISNYLQNYSIPDTPTASLKEGFSFYSNGRVYIALLKTRFVGWNDSWTDAQKITALRTFLNSNYIHINYKITQNNSSPLTLKLPTYLAYNFGREQLDSIAQTKIKYKENIVLQVETNRLAIIDLENEKLDKVTSTTTNNQVYAKLANGNQIMLNVTGANMNSSIVERDSLGNVQFNAPTIAKHGANKEYVDGNFLLQMKNVTTYIQVYGKQENGNKLMYNVTPNALGNSIMYRDVNNQCNVGVPTQNTHITNKEYVDNRSLAFNRGSILETVTSITLNAGTKSILCSVLGEDGTCEGQKTIICDSNYNNIIFVIFGCNFTYIHSSRTLNIQSPFTITAQYLAHQFR